jgi:hypothetical protein
VRDAEYCIDREANGRKRDGMFRYKTFNTLLQARCFNLKFMISAP